MPTRTRQRKKTQLILLLLGSGGALFGALALLLFLPSVRAVSVGDVGGSLGLTSADLIDTVIRVINYALGFLGLIAVSIVIWGGYIWLTSAGNEDRIAQAKRIIRNAVIGVTIILFSWVIVNFVISQSETLFGPGGGTCTEGEISLPCSRCVSGVWEFDSSLCTLPESAFEIRSITTSCGSPPAYNDDVFLCSAIAVNFNHYVDTTPLQSLVETEGGTSVPMTNSGFEDFSGTIDDGNQDTFPGWVKNGAGSGTQENFQAVSDRVEGASAIRIAVASGGYRYKGPRTDDIPVEAGSQRIYEESVWVMIPEGETLVGSWELHRHALPASGCTGPQGCHHYTILPGQPLDQYRWTNDSIPHGVWVRKWIRIQTDADVVTLRGFVITVLPADGTSSGVVLADNLTFRDITGPEPARLTVAQCDDGVACTATSLPTPVFNEEPPAIRYSGASPTGVGAEIVAGGRSISFLHSNLFEENTYYKLTVPKVIQDTSGLALSGCKGADGAQIPGCNDTGDAFEWVFRVGTDTDTTSPTLEDAYPTADTAHPDRNVSRNPIIWGRFSEHIAPWFVTADNITVTGFSAPPDDDGTGGTLGTEVPSTDYDVAMNSSGDGFELALHPGVSFDAFAWYQIDVINLRDLCSNPTEPPALSWRFETNGLAAGIAFVHPSDGFGLSCADTDVFIQFNTSMYNPLNESCEVGPGLGYVQSGDSDPNMPRVFQVLDDLPEDGDPNEYCKRYGFEPTTGLLNYSQGYAMDIRTNYVIDETGRTLSKDDWNFGTAESAETCVDEPFITQLSPSSGPVGACLSVIGGNFDRVEPAGRGPNDSLTFTDADASTLLWENPAIVATAPDNPLGASPVKVTVDYGGTVGLLSSNTVDFNYLDSSAPAGPCLTGLTPSSGLRGQNYQLHGLRFNPDSVMKRIYFDGLPFLPGSWTSDTLAQSTVPDDAPLDDRSLVSLRNDAGRSNELPFDVGSVPPGAFRLVDSMPTCGSACPNAAVQANFSEPLTLGTVSNDTVELFKCATPDCAVEGLTEVGPVPTYAEGTNFVLFSPSGGLEVGKSYRAIVHGTASGVKSVDGDLLTSLNYDAPPVDGTNDSVSWTFTAASSADGCDLSHVSVQPLSSSVPLHGTRIFSAFPYTDPNECNPLGEELNPDLFSWDWTSSSSDVRVDSTTEPSTLAHGDQPTEDPAEVHAATGGKDNFGLLSVVPNQCVTDADCATDDFERVCTGSRCIDSICSPAIQAIAPASGAVGNWVTINACYIGRYIDGQSTVTFLGDTGVPGDDRPGMWPSPSICGPAGSTWRDDLNQIIVEVPNKSTPTTTDDITVEGALRIRRGQDGSTDDSIEVYNPNGPVIPGICRVTPSQGSPGITIVAIEGQNFGETRTSGADFVTFYENRIVPDGSTTWVGDTRVEVTIPLSATNNPSGGEITLMNDGQTSNPYEFGVVPSDCQICTTDVQCPDPDHPNPIQYGCGYEGPFRCCALRPRPVDTRPLSSPTVCRNASVTGGFNGEGTGLPMEMNLSTINPTTLFVEKWVGAPLFWERVPLTSSSFRFPTRHSFIVNPGYLDANTLYQVTVVGDESYDGESVGVQNTERVAPSFTWRYEFTTNESLCEIATVRIEPSSKIFTAFGDSEPFLATAEALDGTPIYPLPGVYDWTWEWSSASASVATVTSNDVDPADGRIDDAQTVTSVGNGSTTVAVEAHGTAGWTGTKTATSAVTVAACDNPWPASPPYLDTVVFGQSTNFSFWFCRDGAPLLPDFRPIGGHAEPSVPGTDEEMRTFFFENPSENPDTNKHDAIGLLVWENEERLSPGAWYTKKFGQAAPSESVTDGYASIRVGGTLYIAGTNLVNRTTLYTNIYVIGINDDAGSDTRAVFGQILANFHLNDNGSDFAYADPDTDALTALAQVRRDTIRIADLHDYQVALDTYEGTNGSYPLLSAGSYIEGMTVSKWPSWTETFNAALGSTGASVGSVDPTNTYAPACSGGYAADTCWDDIAKQFLCPADSYVYAYKAASGSVADLYAHLEYLGDGNWQTGDVNPCSSPSTCGCFNYTLQSVAGIARGGGDRAAPPAPEGVTVRAAGERSIALSWEAAADDSDVLAFRILRNAGVEQHEVVGVVASSNPAFTDDALAPNVAYAYTVVAVDRAGNVSPSSVEVSATTAPIADTAPPDDPGGLSVTAHDASATLSWTDPHDADLTGVAVYRMRGTQERFARDDAEASFVANITPGTEDLSIDGLEGDAAFTIGLFAFDGTKNYAAGAFASVTPTVTRYDRPIEKLTVSPESGALLFAWANPEDAAFGGVRIRRSTGASPATPEEGELVADLDARVSTYRDTGLGTTVQYAYAFFARNTDGAYAEAVTASATPSEPSYGDGVRIFYAYGGDRTVTLAWRKPTDADYRGVLVRRSTDGYPTTPDEGEFVADVAGSTESSEYAMDVARTNGVQYYYSAFAHDGRQRFAPAAYATATPDAVAPGIADVSIAPASITENSLVVAWQTNEPAYSVVEYGTADGGIAGTIMDGELTTRHRMDVRAYGIELAPNAAFRFRVLAVDAQGNVTTGTDLHAVTDFVDAAGVRWHGYEGSRRTTTWNGCADTGLCDSNDLQYYACRGDGVPDCGDPRNGADDGVPGASTACGAIAFADCLDGEAHLAQGKDVVDFGPTGEVAVWNGTRLPTAKAYETACAVPPRFLGAPLSDGTWTSTAARSAAGTARVAGDPRSCTGATDHALNDRRPFLIISPP